MPIPPARLTSADLSTLALTPRSQTTILPAAFAGSREFVKQRLGLVPPASATLAAVTSGPVSAVAPAVRSTETDAPPNVLPSPRVTVAS
jgi:hypothetical protein